MNRKIAIIGLGYAGLHTAIGFGLTQSIIGFDIDEERIKELKLGYDRHEDFTSDIVKKAKINFTSDASELDKADFYIVIMPTPIKKGNDPDFSYLVSASSMIGNILKKGDIVVYESTVYPGATEEVCLPILIEKSNLELGKDFKIGYSPERINPGDREHTFSNTIKIVAGSDDEGLELIAKEYERVVTAGVFRASNIRTAEAVKIVENIQRDTNIALINELSQLFHGLDIDTPEVIKAAQTKWNFIPYHPGLVGGHCIGVDPYYLLYKANEISSPLEIINTARNVNEHMSKFIAGEAIKLLLNNKALNSHSSIAILGITFKENYDDVRNSKVSDLGKELESYGLTVYYYDPIANPEEVEKEYGVKLSSWEEIPEVSGIIIAVAHDQFKSLNSSDYQNKLTGNGILMDLKAVLDKKEFEKQNISIWRL